ncbi:hypothetical protein AWC38_SpisGene25783 [Stylophora pistillata]|uniref:Uncharacterized protein n=1 Tax=Stylophora pistillata TaxID=50429 RepID=A0A2B4RKD5_STYPI|nr:hypothetical protein AWC38_SpisGene25783 [Stylophora pistillata]
MRAAEVVFLLPVLFLVFPRFYHVYGTTSIVFSTVNVSLTSTQARAAQSTSAAVKVVLSKNVSISKSPTQSHVKNTTVLSSHVKNTPVLSSHVRNTTVLSSLSASALPSMSSSQITGSLSATQIKYTRNPTPSPPTASSRSKRAVVSSPVSKKILASKNYISS